MDNLINRCLDGRYRIEQQLGAGGMANVYRGTDLQTNRPIAVKILKSELMNNPDLVRRFKNEAKAVSLLNHPNITKVYDVGVSDDMWYIVMEYIEGITLKEYMEYRGKALTYKETLHFVMQVLAALQHAHEKGIVHRDIKPQNIMLLADGTIKVMDFGIARFSRSESNTMTDKAIGSVHYISPEQARGRATDVRADIYSVGVMMYEMLTAHLPFESDSPVSVAIKQISEQARPMRELNPAIPPTLAAITARAMAKEPRERYPSAREMMADLEEFKRNPTAVRQIARPQPALQQERPRPAPVREEERAPGEEPTRFIERVEDDTAKKTGPAGRSGPQRRRAQGAAGRGRTRASSAKRGKRSLLLPILAGISAAFAIGAAILVFVIFSNSSSDLFAAHEDVELPNFSNMTWADVQSNSAYANFRFEIEEQYNSEVAAGVIFNQSPKPPKTVKDNASIRLYVSLGTQVVKVPNLIGQDKNEAMKALSANDILFRIVTEQTDETTPNRVLRMEPQAGTEVRTGSGGDTVTLVVSREKVEMNSLPTYVGRLVDDVRAEFERDTTNKYRIGTVTEKDDTSPAGTILVQDPAPGTLVTKGQVINVTISTGVVPATRIVNVVFDQTVDEGDWTLTFADGSTATYHTTAGKAETWAVSITNINTMSVTLTGPNVSQTQEINFGEGGTDIVFGPITGSTPTSSSSSQPQDSSSETPPSSSSSGAPPAESDPNAGAAPTPDPNAGGGQPAS
ncbi:MAG TPA: Stk1 family PASTA domain-containing Ser/Thr kinase [Candidatus Ruthenibacterium merdigallinarum]|nr:Stk1 family PASTA domain-containing Ser/Thr kinase [Candidatus Ruthenibacterium merdigallinarum]